MKMKFYKTIDFYITQKFLGTFFYAITLIISIATVFDISENLDEFISKNIPTRDIIVDYYLNFIPYFANLFSPLFTFIAVIYFTSKMAYNTEIIAILSSGVSYRRLMRPYVFSAFIIAVFTFILGNYVIPPANKGRVEFRNKYITQNNFRIERDIHRQIEPGVYIYMQSFGTGNIGYRFTLERFENRELVEKLTADNIRWDEESEKWIINNYWKRTWNNEKEVIEKGYRLDTTLNMTPGDYKIERDQMETLTTTQLSNEIKSMKQRGVNPVEFEIEKHKRISGPFSAFILTIIGAALASRKIKGGLGFHLGLGLLLSFSYILFMQITVVFAVSGSMPPIVAVWIPNLIFSTIAFFVYRWAAR
ncbi:MAG TPA: LptF/LptG family permease [Prolixibacteraceae bacterium]|nr:LptF/LptG family permease [Prolixibacteraceae bacterium]